MQIEPMTGIHADAVVAIYQAGIDEGNATFETRAPCWAEFTARRLPARSYVATSHGTVLGWVATSAVSDRCGYTGVIEHSVSVSPAARGLAVGRQLLQALSPAEAAGIWTIQSSICPETPPASPFTTPPDSATSAPASASHATTDAGATPSSSKDESPAL
jgi:L-amino acid N-acyltransferase YncA